MVVLESGAMVSTIGNNQYLQPEYLSPLPTTLDAKKSPLALLAQTCSQIGADSSSVKSLMPSMDKTKKPESSSKSPSNSINRIENNKMSVTPTESSKQYVFKPYEMNVLTRKDDRPSSKSSVSDNSSDDKIKSNVFRDKSVSPVVNVGNNSNSSAENGKSTPSGSDRKSASPGNSSQRGASPIIRSGLEVLQGHNKDMGLGMYKPGNYGLNHPALAGLCCPPGMEQHTNPAFRPPFAGAYQHHHAAMLAAAGYPPTSAASNPYVSYARVKTPSGAETLVPVCKDPYCTGCQFSLHNQQMMMGAPCPSGCTQCEQQKYGLALAMSQIPGHPYAQLGRPYICNWIAGESYCGKRFGNSDELLQHLRTHTNNLADPAAAAVLASAQAPLMHPLSSLFASASLHRGYPPTSEALNSLSAARYHPYAKPGSLQSALQSASPYGAFNPALGSYYSPYAMYGQRLGAAAVHP